MNGNSAKRSGASDPVHTAPTMRFAESRRTSSCHPGVSPKDVTRTSLGNRISTRVVGVFFSFGTRSTYRSYAPGVDAFGNTTACAIPSAGTARIRAIVAATMRRVAAGVNDVTDVMVVSPSDVRQ